MPYKTVTELPDEVKSLPQHAKEIYLAAFNNAWEQHKDENGAESKCHAIAWAAVKNKYEKNNQEEWVAKEANQIHPSKKILQAKYSEIVREYGRKNAFTDAQRIHKIMELCQELLDPIEEEIDAEKSKKVSEALKEADSVLALLKEQKAMKTEEGEQYPADAYAYAPDPEKPSEWKLRIWEDPQKKVTRAQLGKAAAALSPGGFRGQRVDISKEDLPAVKRKIRTEYRKLDVDDEDIPKWVKESEVRTYLADFITLSEATVSSKGIATVVVIKPGLNSSKERYYPPEVLSRDYQVFEGVKMYADHPTEEEDQQRPERSIRDWVATLKNVHVDEKGQLIGEAVVVEPWLQQKLAALRDKGMLQEMGISINAVGTATRGEIDGVKTNVIERIVRVRSVDFVTEPGAGGMVQMYEAGNPEYDVDLVSLDILRERRPDLVKAIETEVKAVISQEVKKQMNLEEENRTLKESNETLTKENTDLKNKLTEADKAKAKADAQAKIKEAIDKAELPDAAKVRLLERFKDAEKADDITEAIKAEVDYIAALKESVKPRNLGNNPPGTPVTKEQLKESFRKLGMSEKEAEIAANAR